MRRQGPVYPNREHENADKAARRRALRNLSDLSDQAIALHRRLFDADGRSYVDSADGRTIAETANRLTENLTVMETLRDVREWHAADEAERVIRTKDGRLTAGHPHGGAGPHPGWKGHDGHAVHRHEMSTGRAEWELTREDGSPVTVPLP